MSDLIINPNERAVSSDINRLQTLLRTQLEESFRWMFGASTSETQSAGVATVSNTVTAPPGAVILNGVMGAPELANSNIDVTPGCMYVTDTDSPPNADASLFKLIVTAGTAAPLVLSPNSSGLTRIDVLECKRNPGVVIEVDTRDVFNGLTGIFTATSINKVEQDQLTFRLRTSPPGTGYSGNQPGWLPLMVCIVPNGFTSNDQCTFFDVRPLGSDLASTPFDNTDYNVGHGRMNAQCLPNVYVGGGTHPTQLQTFGTVNVTLNDRKLGGYLPGLGGTFVDILDATNVQEAGLAFPGSSQGLWFLYLATFYGLPRWCRYTPSTAGVRIPSSPRGVPVFSLKSPDFFAHAATNLVAPAGLGFAGANSSDAKLALAGTWNNIGLAFALVSGLVADNGRMLMSESAANYQWRYPTVAGYAVITIIHAVNEFSFALVDNTSHPLCAARVRVRIQIDYDFGAAPVYTSGMIQVQTLDQSAGAAAQPFWAISIELASGGTANIANVGNRTTFECDIPLYYSQVPVSRAVFVSITQEGGAGATILDVGIEVLGWTMRE